MVCSYVVFWCCDLYMDYVCLCFFFKQKTAYEVRISDWSSDVCSSDLHRLPAGYRALWFGERHLDGILVIEHAQLTGHIALAVAHLGAALELACGRRAGNPRWRRGAQQARIQERAVGALIDVKDVACPILANHIPSRGFAAPHATDLQSFTMTPDRTTVRQGRRVSVI